VQQSRQMLRLHHDGVSAREIERRLGAVRSTIQDNLKRAAASGLTWLLPAELTDDELEQRLFARMAIKPGSFRDSVLCVLGCLAVKRSPYTLIAEKRHAYSARRSEGGGRVRAQPILGGLHHR
jgi:hypothetical protein